MKTYTITLSKSLFDHLDAAIQYATLGIDIRAGYKVTGEEKDAFETKYNVTIEAESDDVFFNIGYFLERMRQENQSRHYDLHDKSTISVDVPQAFFMICKLYRLYPSKALTLFAGDLCQHPFITNGSDERSLAVEYWHRSYNLDEKKQEQAEDLFQHLFELRSAWGGNDKMEQYKEMYANELKRLEKLFIKGKK
jgi:hypothetical protein